MKKIILTSIIILAGIITYAGEKEYEQNMKKNLKELQKTESSEEFLRLAKNFQLIAEQEGDKWLPYYYVSYSYLNYVFSGEAKDDIDEVLDKADKFLAIARTKSGENSEIEVLQGWIYQGRIQVDPMGRGMTYSQKASASFGQAMNLDPENPRIYFLTGMNILYTPEMFGGGKEKACPYFMKGREKYENFKPESSIAPDWGKESNAKLAADCNTK